MMKIQGKKIIVWLQTGLKRSILPLWRVAFANFHMFLQACTVQSNKRQPGFHAEAARSNQASAAASGAAQHPQPKELLEKEELALDSGASWTEAAKGWAGAGK